MKKLIPFIFPIVILLFSVISGYFIHKSAWFVHDSHFVKLATSFINNDLFLSPFNLPPGDYADYRAKQYLFFGPLPSILLVPFVYFFGENFPQMFLSIFGLFITYVFVYLLCKKINFKTPDSIWLANFFVFGTVLYFVSLVNISAYVVQAVAMPFVVLALWEYFSHKRYFVIGVFVALAIATRISLLGLALFFIFEIVRQRKKIDFVKSILYFSIPIVSCLAILGIYNYRRFNSIFDTGYTRNVSVLDKENGNYKKGFFSPVHISANLYSLLVMAPEPVLENPYELVLKFPYLKANGFGLAIWFTSTLFVFLIKAKKKEYTVNAVIGVVLLALPSLVYFGIGASQYGYRYGLDFIPLLFLILLSAFPNGLTPFAKTLIFIGIIFNMFYMLSIWNSFPLFFWLG